VRRRVAVGEPILREKKRKKGKNSRTVSGFCARKTFLLRGEGNSIFFAHGKERKEKKKNARLLLSKLIG